MPARRGKTAKASAPRKGPALVAAVSKKRDPFPFVLDELEPASPWTRPMFGCLAVYVGERIVLILRDKGPADRDSGVWVASAVDQRAALHEALPRLEPIEIFGDRAADWKKLSSRSLEFEDDVMTACAMVLRGDVRIGKVPGQKRKARAAAKSKDKTKPKSATKPKSTTKR